MSNNVVGSFIHESFLRKYDGDFEFDGIRKLIELWSVELDSACIRRINFYVHTKFIK